MLSFEIHHLVKLDHALCNYIQRLKGRMEEDEGLVCMMTEGAPFTEGEVQQGEIQNVFSFPFFK